MNNEKQKPVHEIRLGLVRASIWENKSEYGVRHNVTLERLYPVKLDENRRTWKSTSSFGAPDQLPTAGSGIRYSIAKDSFRAISSEAPGTKGTSPEGVS